MKSLSILICSLDCRKDFLARLLAILEPQTIARDDVEVLVDLDDGQVPIGTKRNRLLDRSAGRWVCYIDDDDTVEDDYVAQLVSALSGDPDCVGFRANWYEDERHTGDARYDLANPARDEILQGERFLIRRWPGHLTPVRREVAIAVGFEPWNYGEDADFSIRLRPRLKSQAFVDRVLYHYWLRGREARAGEKVHPQRWQDDNFRIERSLKRSLEFHQRNSIPSPANA